ncbi:hypothetical protein AL387_gp206 [Salmon gill poxvirus]|uniref:Uncharacterized protein n=1 Tax=Salmon gill poxvirus TaxID=1680908 RepID=A0A0H4Y1F5_9POXV|nr:hypothetical protein AL387_gp206 [Salmon gill poxvirus]AKR04330.1 hypothetical protein SGPV206 [Salmon gill poxvirus]
MSSNVPVKAFKRLNLDDIRRDVLDATATIIFTSYNLRTSETVIHSLIHADVIPLYVKYNDQKKRIDAMDLVSRRMLNEIIITPCKLEVYKYTGMTKGNMLVVTMEGAGMWEHTKDLVDELPNLKLIARMVSLPDWVKIKDRDHPRPDLTRTYISVQNLGDMGSQDFFIGMTMVPQIDKEDTVLEILEKLRKESEGKGKDMILGMYNGAGAQLGIKSKLLPYSSVVDFSYEQGILGMSNYQKSPDLYNRDTEEITVMKQFNHTTGCCPGGPGCPGGPLGGKPSWKKIMEPQVMLETAGMLSVMGSIRTERPGEPTYVLTPDYWKIKNTLRVFK